jgi:shikimate kinase
MGAGKSSVGRALAEQLGWAFEDLDERIERRERRKVPEIFRDSGEQAFRKAEHAALRELLSELDAGTEKVLALGGGAFAQNDNAMLIEDAGVPTVFLDASVEELWRRCQEQALRQGIERPLGRNVESFRELYEARRPHYLRAALQQDTGDKTVAEIAAEVVQALGLGVSSEAPRRKAPSGKAPTGKARSHGKRGDKQ